jgi:hypothetical protein
MRAVKSTGAARKQINEVFKGGMKVSRAFKGKGITDSVRERVVFEVV